MGGLLQTSFGKTERLGRNFLIVEPSPGPYLSRTRCECAGLRRRGKGRGTPRPTSCLVAGDGGVMKNQIKSIVLLGVLSALLIVLGGALAPGYLYLFTALALAMNLGAYFFSDRIVLALHRARELAPHEAPELHGIVQELADRARLPKPRVFLIPEAQPNAFATGRNPQHAVVAVTEGILQI